MSPGLPFASSLCGACAEVCPVKIDIPKILLDLRSEVKKAEAREGTNRLERLAFRVWAWVMRHPRLYEMAGMAAASLAPSGDGGGWVRNAPSWGIRVPPMRRLAQPEGPAVRPGKELPAVVAGAPLMSREHVLHKVRTALGRSAGQPMEEPPPVRLTVPEAGIEAQN